MTRPATIDTKANPTSVQISNLYGRLEGFRRLSGVVTAQSAKDFNGIVATLRSMDVLTQMDAFAFQVNELGGIQGAFFSGLPEKAGQLLALLDRRYPKLSQHGDESLVQWIIQHGVGLSMVVSDISNSCQASVQMGNAQWQETVSAFVESARELAKSKNGFFVKTSGDDSLVVFANAEFALDFAIELHRATLPLQIVLHQGLHVGRVAIEAADIVGSEVSLTYRVAAWAKAGHIAATDTFKKEFKRHDFIAYAKTRPWRRSPGITLKGFDHKLTLWWLEPSIPH